MTIVTRSLCNTKSPLPRCPAASPVKPLPRPELFYLCRDRCRLRVLGIAGRQAHSGEVNASNAARITARTSHVFDRDRAVFIGRPAVRPEVHQLPGHEVNAF